MFYTDIMDDKWTRIVQFRLGSLSSLHLLGGDCLLLLHGGDTGHALLPLGDLHHALRREHRVDEVQRHGHVVKHAPAPGVGARGETRAGEARPLQVTRDAVAGALARGGHAAVAAGAAAAAPPAGLDAGELLRVELVHVERAVRAEQRGAVPRGEGPHAARAALLQLALAAPQRPPGHRGRGHRGGPGLGRGLGRLGVHLHGGVCGGVVVGVGLLAVLGDDLQQLLLRLGQRLDDLLHVELLGEGGDQALALRGAEPPPGRAPGPLPAPGRPLLLAPPPHHRLPRELVAGVRQPPGQRIAERRGVAQLSKYLNKQK